MRMVANRTEKGDYQSVRGSQENTRNLYEEALLSNPPSATLTPPRGAL